MALITPRHFVIFKAEVQRSIRALGLDGWNVTFRQMRLPGTKARVSTDYMGRVVLFMLATRWNRDYPVTDAEIRSTARHEVIHLALAEVSAIGSSRWSTKDEYDSAEETLVVRLQNRIRW